jgi:acyl carrier protein
MVEERIAAIWCEALQIDHVGRYDNFFDLGGHSLLMAQVFSRLQTEFKREISMLELFRYPTINSLGNYLSQGQVSEPKVEQAAQRAGMRLNAVRRPR